MASEAAAPRPDPPPPPLCFRTARPPWRSLCPLASHRPPFVCSFLLPVLLPVLPRWPQVPEGSTLSAAAGAAGKRAAQSSERDPPFRSRPARLRTRGQPGAERTLGLAASWPLSLSAGRLRRPCSRGGPGAWGGGRAPVPRHRVLRRFQLAPLPAPSSLPPFLRGLRTPTSSPPPALFPVSQRGKNQKGEKAPPGGLFSAGGLPPSLASPPGRAGGHTTNCCICCIFLS